MFVESGAIWADTYLSSGIVVFDALRSKTLNVGVITMFEIQKNVALSHRVAIKGSAGDANAFVERVLKVDGTSRSWSTIKGLVGKNATLS